MPKPEELARINIDRQLTCAGYFAHPLDLLRFYARFFILVTACTSHNDTTYLTPIPQATWQAYQRGSPVNTKLEAVIAARSSFYFHLQAVTEPIPLFVEKMTREDAYTSVPHRPRDYPDSRPKNMKVWIVLFEGDWQVLSPPPADEATPSPDLPFHGCVFVLIDPTNGGDFAQGSTPCKP